MLPISAKPVGATVTSQSLILRDDQSGLLTHIVMLLNEFLKEHRKNEEQETTIAQLKQNFQFKLAEHQKQIEALTAGLQRVSARLELNKPAPQTVLNSQ